jgi:D-alanine-D-alanine ligase
MPARSSARSWETRAPRSRCREICPRQEFYSYEAKYLDEQGAAFLIPAPLPPEQSAEIRAMAAAVFQALECEGMARVDFFLERETERVFVNEINTIPGFTSISQYPRLWDASGLPFPRLLDRLVELAVERHARKSRLRSSR